MISYQKSSIKELVDALEKKEVTSVSLVEQAFDELEQKNKELNIFINYNKEDALEKAKKADEEIANRTKQKELVNEKRLLGIPIAIKENIAFENEKVSSASNILENHTAVFNATVVQKLKEEGAIIIGNTNLDEFAMGSTTETSAHGSTKNPLNEKKVPGGSSGGSASAVAAGIVPMALGSDTGGSIRQPAAFCDCVGFKPAYGSVSRYGLYALASSLDVIGPITRTVDDAKLVYTIIKGKDSNDPTSYSYTDESGKEVKRVAVLDISDIDVDSEIKEEFEKCIEMLKENGIECETVKIPLIKASPSIYYILQPAEAHSNLARYDGIRYGKNIETSSTDEQYIETRGQGFGEEATRRILLGTHMLSSGYVDEYYDKAAKSRASIRKAFDDIFKEFDVIVSPTSHTLPLDIGTRMEPSKIYANDMFTTPASLAGLPAMSVPLKVTEVGGIGIHITAPREKTNSIFMFGNIIESIYGRQTNK